MFVAENDGDVVGFAAGNMLPEPTLRRRCRAVGGVPAARIPARAASGAAWSPRSPTRSATHGAHGLIVWVIAGNKGARAFYEAARRDAARRAAVRMGRHGLVEAGYGWPTSTRC